MPAMYGLAPIEACSLARRLSQRDMERLLRECNFQVSQINQIQACLKAANQRKNSGNVDAAADEYARALAIDPNNPAHTCKVSALRSEVLLSSGRTRQAVESARLSLNESGKLAEGVWGLGGLGREADTVLGTGLSMLGEHEEAIKAFQAGLARCLDCDKDEFIAQVCASAPRTAFFHRQFFSSRGGRVRVGRRGGVLSIRRCLPCVADVWFRALEQGVEGPGLPWNHRLETEVAACIGKVGSR